MAVASDPTKYCPACYKKEIGRLSIGVDVAFQQTTSKFLFLISSQKGQISSRFPGKFHIFLSRGSKVQVLSTSFWQGLHCSRCQGLNLDMVGFGVFLVAILSQFCQ